MKLHRKTVNGSSTTGSKINLQQKTCILPPLDKEYKLLQTTNGPSNKESLEMQSALIKEQKISLNSSVQMEPIVTGGSSEDNLSANIGIDVPKKDCNEVLFHSLDIGEKTVPPVIQSSDLLEENSSDNSITDTATRKKGSWTMSVQENSSFQNLNAFLTNAIEPNSKMTQHKKKVWLDNFKNSNVTILSTDVLENEIKAAEVTLASQKDATDCNFRCNGVGDSKKDAQNSIVQEKIGSLDSEQNQTRKQTSVPCEVRHIAHTEYAFQLKNLENTNLKRRDSSVPKKGLVKKNKLTSSLDTPKYKNKTNIFSSVISESIPSLDVTSNLRQCYVKLEDINARGIKSVSSHMNAISSKTFRSINYTKKTETKNIRFSDIELVEGWAGWMSRIDHLKGTGLQVVSVAEGSHCYQVFCSDDEDQSQSDQDGDWPGWATPAESHITPGKLINIFRTQHNITEDEYDI